MQLRKMLDKGMSKSEIILFASKSPVLKKMEREGKLQISLISIKSRRRGSFYLDDKTNKIKICLVHE